MTPRSAWARPVCTSFPELDREQWRIIGVDLQASGGDPQVIVYAVDTSRLEIDGDGHDHIHDEHGQVPVTAVRLRASTQVEEFLSRAFQRISLRLVARGFRDETITVEDTVDAAEPSAN